FRDFLRVKYAEQRFDLVIAIDNPALEFVEAYRKDLFANTPVVFFANAPVAQRPPNSTGVIQEINLKSTLTLAMELQPDVRRVYVISGADSSDKQPGTFAESLAQFPPFKPRLTIEYLKGLATKELESRLAKLPEHSIIYYLSVSRDGTGQNFH